VNYRLSCEFGVFEVGDEVECGESDFPDDWEAQGRLSCGYDAGPTFPVQQPCAHRLSRPTSLHVRGVTLSHPGHLRRHVKMFIQQLLASNSLWRHSAGTLRDNLGAAKLHCFLPSLTTASVLANASPRSPQSPALRVLHILVRTHR
jgi:hypothetical protein